MQPYWELINIARTNKQLGPSGMGRYRGDQEVWSRSPMNPNIHFMANTDLNWDQLNTKIFL